MVQVGGRGINNEVSLSSTSYHLSRKKILKKIQNKSRKRVLLPHVLSSKQPKAELSSWQNLHPVEMLVRSKKVQTSLSKPPIQMKATLRASGTSIASYVRMVAT